MPAGGNNGVGVTRSFVNNFLMADGTPVYTHGDYMNEMDIIWETKPYTTFVKTEIADWLSF